AFAFAPSPLQGEGWGEGRDVRTPHANVRVGSLRASTLSLTLSLQGRGNQSLPASPATEAPALMRGLSAVAALLLRFPVLGGLAFFRVLAGGLGLEASPADFVDRQAQLAARDVDPHDEDLRHVADADARPRALAADVPAALVDVPPVVHQVLVADQTVDQ